MREERTKKENAYRLMQRESKQCDTIQKELVTLKESKVPHSDTISIIHVLKYFHIKLFFFFIFIWQLATLINFSELSVDFITDRSILIIDSMLLPF